MSFVWAFVLVRSAIPCEVVHRYGVKGGARLCHQTQKSGEDEGDQRTGTLPVPFVSVSQGHASVLTWLREIKSRENVLEWETAVSKSTGDFGSVCVERMKLCPVSAPFLLNVLFLSPAMPKSSACCTVLVFCIGEAIVSSNSQTDISIYSLCISIFVLVMLHLFSLFHHFKPLLFLQRVKSGRESSARGRREGSASSGKWTILFHPHQSVCSAVCNVQHFTFHYFFLNLLSNAVNQKECSPKTTHTPPHKINGMNLTPSLL